jgi:hypothetical protein
MRAALARGAVALAFVAMTAAACGSDPATPSPSPSPSAAGSPSGSPSASPSSDGAESQAEFCANLNAFASAAGPVFDIGAIALIDGETPNERKSVSQAVDSIVLHGVLLKPEMPADLADDLETVVRAAAGAKAKLAAGAPASEAVAALQTDKVDAARDAVVKYRGTC